jgi:putative phage-type endonuclease
MRKVNLDQGSPEWLEWRKGIITATDAAVLLGASPYCTPYGGWLKKTGQATEQPVNSAMLRGQRDEPIARKMFTEKTGINMTPCCVESSTYNFLGASLDGLSDCGSMILEIKSNGDRYHDNLSTRGIPEFHMMQIQHQLLCGEECLKLAYYVSYNNGEIVIKEIYPDRGWMQAYLKKAKEFWRQCIFFESPPLSPKDYSDKNYDLDFCRLAAEYVNIDQAIKQLEENKNNFKQELVNLCNNQNCAGNGIKVLKKTIKGRIDYEKIPELENINLDQYRKESTCSWNILTNGV